MIPDLWESDAETDAIIYTEVCELLRPVGDQNGQD